jgi:group I intron endonuclease
MYSKDNLGEIYKLTSPSEKCYIGQSVCVLSNGKKHGHQVRWRQHVYEAINFKQCSVVLDNAIRKYGHENFKIELLQTCALDEIDYWENVFILKNNSLHPNGYNLMTGKSNSRQCDATREKRRVSMIGKNKGRNMQKRERIREEDKDLPKYVRSYKDSSNKKEGFRVSHHPLLKEKSFLSNKLSLEEKLELALQYVNSV